MKPIEFTEGDVVIVEAPDFFKGEKLAAYLARCKDHENGYRCYLLKGDEITKNICVQPFIAGNSIQRLS